METKRHIHFVTGRLAAEALRANVKALSTELKFEFTIDVLPISVAALMTPHWIAKHMRVPKTATEVMLPGYCEGDLSALQSDLEIPVLKGPRDLRELASFYGRESTKEGYGEYSIEIIAEINHVPKLSIAETLAVAEALRADGADLIDVGCIPGYRFDQVGQYVAALRDAGHRVSIDSFDCEEIRLAVQAGAELVLSVNATNREQAADWGCEVIAIPDEIPTMGGLDETIVALRNANVPFRIDPILEPIGCGFAASLGRYLSARERYPGTPMMMGIGNLTELTDCDSAGVNVILLAICEELNISSVLTTQVISWAKTSVRECDLARRLVHHAIRHQVIPKHLEPRLIALRDADRFTSGQFEQLAATIKDNNFRTFADAAALHIVAANLHLRDEDPFRLFDQLLEQRPETIDAGHAFYLGFELAKATIARTLDKNYRQDEPLDWGYLTAKEDYHRIRRTWRRRREQDKPHDQE